MRQFLQDLSSLHWWIAVVAVGILLNLCSAYLKNRIDKSLSSVSTWWKRRTEAQEAKRAATIEELRNDSGEQIKFTIEEMRQRFMAVSYLVLALLLFVLSNDTDTNVGEVSLKRLLWLLARVVTLAICGITTLVALRCLLAATDMQSMLDEAATDADKRPDENLQQ